MLTIAPVIVVFVLPRVRDRAGAGHVFFAQKAFVQGVTLTGVEG
jgi:hypothetical protein